ncbi:MAG: DinB family protein [Bacteroidota bacterium]
METTTTNRMLSLVALYDLHTGFLPKALVDITDDSAHNRLNTKANHIAWLTGSLVQQRFELAGMLGVHHQQAAHDLFKDNKGIQDGVRYPSLAGFKNDWEMISPILNKLLVNVSDEKLDSELDMGGMKMTFYELVTFIIYREANCIGQIALWRRLLGYDALKYD